MNCPICSAETDPKYRPFCSARCADIDLGRWMRGVYAVPLSDDEGVEADPDEGEAAVRKPH